MVSWGLGLELSNLMRKNCNAMYQKGQIITFEGGGISCLLINDLIETMQ